MSGFASGAPVFCLPPCVWYISNVSLGSQGQISVAHCFSIHLSGIVKGRTQSSALAGIAAALAVAVTSTDVVPNSCAISVGIELDRAAVRYAVTCTISDCPVTGSRGNVTSGGVTDGDWLATRFACAAPMALVTAGPLADWSVKLLNARAVAPASAPASAEFWACERAVRSMPTSIASTDTA